MKKVFIVGGNYDYTKLFADNGFAVVSDSTQADLFCFTGGEDVSPELYGELKHPYSYCSPQRDVAEKRIFRYCVEKDIPMVGICRGGQFLNVMSGGKMYQHVTNHTGTHYATDVTTGESFLVSSTHHQMMRPGKDGEVLCIANQQGSKEHMGENGIIKAEGNEDDVEVVYYRTTDCLCFQPHPEFLGEQFLSMKNYFFSLIHKHLGV